MKLDLIPNVTTLYQLGTFVALYIGVNQLLAKPFLNIYNKRISSTSGLREECDELRKKTELLASEYEEKITQTKLRAISFREELKKLAETEAAKKVAEARANADLQIKRITQEIETARVNAQSQLEKDAHSLSKSLVEKILGKGVS